MLRAIAERRDHPVIAKFRMTMIRGRLKREHFLGTDGGPGLPGYAGTAGPGGPDGRPGEDGKCSRIFFAQSDILHKQIAITVACALKSK